MINAPQKVWWSLLQKFLWSPVLVLVLGLSFLPNALGSDASAQIDSILSPVVQFYELSEGSGVVVRSREKSPGSGIYENFIFTADHNIVQFLKRIEEEVGSAVAENLNVKLPTRVYEYNASGLETSRTEYAAEILLRGIEDKLDFALLKIESEKRLKNALVKRGTAPSLFAPVYLVSTPIGVDPIRTLGSVARLGARVKRDHYSEEGYTMITAPGHIGSSGGGVFLRETLELAGIYSAIHTDQPLHGLDRFTVKKVIPFLGLMVPVDQIYKFLDEKGYSFLIRK